MTRLTDMLLRRLLPAAFVSIVIGAVLPATAQDNHLSQYDMAPLYINPALTGMYLGEKNTFKICANYRAQWQRLQAKPYSSVALSYDMPYKRFGFGAYVMDNLSGEGNFGTLNFLVSGAYQVTDDNSRNHYLTTGIQLGFIQRRFYPPNLTYETQYTSTDGIDPDLPSGELFNREHRLNFDANMGMYYRYNTDDARYAPYIGISVYHLSMPDQSFTGTKIRTPMRFNAHAGIEMNFNDQVKLTPNVLVMYQQKAMEINAGLLASIPLQNSPYEVMAGGSYRVKDAAIVHLGLKQGHNIFRISYDIITSDLRHYGGRRSGFEMGVVYTGPGKKGPTIPQSL